MAKPKKYNFLPEHQLKTPAKDVSEYSVTITSAMGIHFPKFVVSVWGLDKKVVRLYADISSKTIAWKEVKGGNTSELKDVRQLTTNKLNGTILVGVGKLLKQMGITKDMLPMRNVPVNTYKDSLLEGDLKIIDLRNYAKTKNNKE